MATTTTHYSLKKYEGADLFNPLTYENANADAIDSAMYANAQQGVGPATELTAGTVHAITRGNADSPIFAFTATSNFAEGDTFTVDGTPVTALLPSGETLPGGAYVVGSEVLAYLRSSLLTIFVSKKTVDASDVDYDHAASGLTATDAQGAIDELSVISSDYDGSEVLIGTWADNKPLYRKAFHVESIVTLQADTQYAGAIGTIDTNANVVGIYGTITENNVVGVKVPFPSAWDNGTDIKYLRWYYNPATGDIMFQGMSRNVDYAIKQIDFVAYYTK